jgi:HlyD family secretion protein
METEERLTEAKTADEDVKNAIAQRNTLLEEVKNVEAQIKAGHADVKQAEAQLKAAKDDSATQTSSLKVIEQDISASRAALDSAASRKADTTIVSQTTGYVVSRELEPGAVVNPGTPILKVADPTTIWATVYVDELYASSFEVGDSAEITLRSMQTSKLKGKVARIRRESDRVTEQIAVDVSFDETPENLRLGEQLEVVIKPRSRTANAIPASALIPSRNGLGVWVVTDGKLTFRKLQTGLVDADGWTEVISGMEEGEKVVVSPGKLADISNEGRAVSFTEEKREEPAKQ